MIMLTMDHPNQNNVLENHDAAVGLGILRLPQLEMTLIATRLHPHALLHPPSTKPNLIVDAPNLALCRCLKDVVALKMESPTMA